MRHPSLPVLALAPLLALLLALAACAQPGGPPGAATPGQAALVSLGGDGEFVELERTSEYSLVEVRKAPKGSVASSMYTLRGVCAVLEARGAAFVASEPVAGLLTTYRLKFPVSPKPSELSGPDKRLFTRADCAALRF